MKYLSILFSLVLLFVAGCGSSDDGKNTDLKAPVVSISSPENYTVATGSTLTVEASVADADQVQKVEFYLDAQTVPAATATAKPWKGTVNLAGLAEGNHTLRAIATNAAGTGSATVLVTTGDLSNVRTPLVEVITSANCNPCGPVNEQFNLLTSSPTIRKRLSIIKYHVWWPLTTDKLWRESRTWCEPRIKWMMTQYVAPKAFVEGADMSNNPQNWFNQLTTDISLAPEAKITLTKTDKGNSFDIGVTIKGISSSSYSDLRLHTVVTESDIEYNDGNSEHMHYDVMRMMLPDGLGERIGVLNNGETLTFTKSFDVASSWKKDKLKVVVFLQSEGSRKILQSATLSLQ